MLRSLKHSVLGQQVRRRRHLLHVVAAIQEHNSLERSLTTLSLAALGIGAVVGAGIFVITGQAAAKYAGPALTLSFVISAFACFFTGLCYAELSAAIPIAGSAYTFSYIAVGELAAWIVAICLSLEYCVAAAAVSVGWSASIQSFLREFGLSIPSVVAKSPLEVVDGTITMSGSLVNLPAVAIITVITGVLCLGVRESARFNAAAVAIKLSVLALFVAYGVYFSIKHNDVFSDNMDPFMPPNDGRYGHFGVSGIFRGAGAVFFAYVGFDSICTMAQECKRPERDLPRGLLITMITTTLLYIVVTIFLTGMVNYTLLNVDDPVIAALVHVDAPVLFRYLVDVGAIAGLTSVCLVSTMSMPRLLFALSHDGLLPKRFGEVHPTYKTPLFATVCCGVFCATVGGLLPLDMLGEIVSFGTLVAFIMVCTSVIMLRKRHPDYPRPFRVPAVPAVPIIGIGACLMQLLSLPPQTFINYSVAMSIGLAVYFLYGRHYSRLQQRGNNGSSTSAPSSPNIHVRRGDGSSKAAAVAVEMAPRETDGNGDDDDDEPPPEDDFTDAYSEDDEEVQVGLRVLSAREAAARMHLMRGEDFRRHQGASERERLSPRYAVLS